MGVSACGGGGGSVSELADGSQNMKQCRGSVWWVRCTELQAGEQACWANYSLMGSFGRQLPGVNVVWRDEVRLKWNFWLENVFKWKGSRQLCADGVGGWLWADACCRTDHHPSMSTAHRRCCDWPLLFNIIPAHSFQDRFTSDSRRFLMLVEFRGNILKLSSFSEEFWQFQNDEKGNILTGHITTLKKNSRWRFSCFTTVICWGNVFQDFIITFMHFPSTFMSNQMRLVCSMTDQMVTVDLRSVMVLQIRNTPFCEDRYVSLSVRKMF